MTKAERMLPKPSRFGVEEVLLAEPPAISREVSLALRLGAEFGFEQRTEPAPREDENGSVRNGTAALMTKGLGSGRPKVGPNA